MKCASYTPNNCLLFLQKKKKYCCSLIFLCTLKDICDEALIFMHVLGMSVKIISHTSIGFEVLSTESNSCFCHKNRDFSRCFNFIFNSVQLVNNVVLEE